MGAPPAVIQLNRWSWTRKTWRIEVGDGDLTVVTPAVKRPWVIPLESISGVCDLSAKATSPDDLTLVRGPRLLDMKTKAQYSSANLLVVLKAPQPLPPLRFGHYSGSGFRRREVRGGSALVDGFSVDAREPGGAASILADRGVTQFPSRRASWIATIGAVPTSTLPEQEQRRVQQRERLRRFVRPMTIATVIALVVARFSITESRVQWWGWLMIALCVVLFIASGVLVRYVTRQDRRPIETARRARSKSFGVPDD
jgi:hypothetical protein